MLQTWHHQLHYRLVWFHPSDLIISFLLVLLEGGLGERDMSNFPDKIVKITPNLNNLE